MCDKHCKRSVWTPSTIFKALQCLSRRYNACPHGIFVEIVSKSQFFVIFVKSILNDSISVNIGPIKQSIEADCSWGSPLQFMSNWRPNGVSTYWWRTKRAKIVITLLLTYYYYFYGWKFGILAFALLRAECRKRDPNFFHVTLHLAWNLDQFPQWKWK